MSQTHRLADGGRLNRTKILRFWYDDKKYEGHPGDTLASALLANGITLIGRSFKYHRPRGIFSAGAEEPNALVQLEQGPYTEPNRRATEVELYDGLIAHSQNCWPSVGFDFGAISSRLWRIFPAGFYYKTFMWPRSLWMTYEKFIRKAAGLGVSPRQPDPDGYDKIHVHCDVLIVGGGPAGLRAACAAGASGARVLLADERSEFGGALLTEGTDCTAINGIKADAWIAERVAELSAMEQVVLLPRTTVTGYYHDNFLIANQRLSEHLGINRGDHAPKERLWKIRAKQVVLATGSIERPLVFADNDRPGVMLAGAMRTYINRFGVLPAKRVVVLTNNDSAYHTALDAMRAGACVVVVDVRAEPDGELVTAFSKQVREKYNKQGRQPIRGGDGEQDHAQDISIHTNCTISAVEYARGKITGVQVMELSPDGVSAHGTPRTIRCDGIAISGGWTPTVHLLSQAGGQLAFCTQRHCFLPACNVVNHTANHATAKPSSNSWVCAGACQGIYRLAECLTEGNAAGIAAATAAGFAAKTNSESSSAETCTEPVYAAMRPLWILPCDHPIGRGHKKHFHELHNDSTVADLHLAAREGFGAIEHLKRYTTTGMGTDQGKTSNLNALSVIADLRGASIAELGVTTYRPPYTPLTFGSIIGFERRKLFLQKRTTPMHRCHEKRGAIFEDVGDWKRPFYFPQPNERMHDAVQRECLAARNSVGIMDASTLGKIDIRGEHAADLLNMIYTNAWGKLAPGRCRYGLMLNEHGMVFDDGVTTCLGKNHYHMTTTTGGAARVMDHLEEWLQTEWPDSKVYCTSVTEQWAVASISGPNSRALLAELCTQPIDAETFPFMSMQSFAVAGIAARVFRISFTGETAFEINVPARFGAALWESLLSAGEKYGICPYGTESMHVLRAEKGFIIVGQDTDGTVTPMDLGMDWIVSKTKNDFVGKRSLIRADTARPGRKQLVGLLTENPNFVLPEGAHVVEALCAKPPMKMLGHVSSSYMSPNVGRSIAMALVADGFRRNGEQFNVALMDGSSHKVTITDPMFFDAEGVRTRA